MKIRLLVISFVLTALVVLAGTGTALADGRGRGHKYTGHERHVVVHHVHHKVVHKPSRVAYGRIHPYPYGYVYPRRVLVEHAPVCAPVRTGWGFTLHWGW